jgi:hypothetical protein
MQKLIVIAIVASLGWYGYHKYEAQAGVESARQSESQFLRQPNRSIFDGEQIHNTPFSCDGRSYCSQMTSCAEATYFLKNCAGVKMDGDNDGVPCEQQWCR